MRPQMREMLFEYLQTNGDCDHSTPKRQRLTMPDSDYFLDESICIVPTKWLKDWFECPEKRPAQLVYADGGKIFNKPGAGTFDLQPFLCAHRRISPQNAYDSIRAISNRKLADANLLHQLGSSREGNGKDSVPVLAPDAKYVLSPCLVCVKRRLVDKKFQEACDLVANEMRRWKRVFGDSTYPLDAGLFDRIETDADDENSVSLKAK